MKINPLIHVTIGIVLAVFLLNYSSSTSYQTERSGATEGILKTQNVSLQYWDYIGEKETIILLHGGPGVPDYLDGVARILNKHGYRVIAYDQRGSGGSTAKTDNYFVKDHVNDLEELRKKLSLDKLHIIGHSWGGTLGQVYARTYPQNIASLYLMNSSVGLGKDWETMENNVMAYNRKQSGLLGFGALGWWSLIGMIPGRIGDNGIRNLFCRIWKNYFSNPDEAPEPDQNWLAGIRGGPIHKTRNDAVRRSELELNDLAGRLSQIPILILYGDNDIYGESKEILLKRFPDAKKIELENSGHLPWLANPLAFEEITVQFYQEVA